MPTLRERMRDATPGDPAGGYLRGQRDQLQKLPQGHGGEFVVNAEATKRYRPLLEAMNRAVPAGGGRHERPARGRSYFEGTDGTADTGMTASEADAALGGTTAPAPSGVTGMGSPPGFDIFAPTPAIAPFGMPYGHALGLPSALAAAGKGAAASVLGPPTDAVPAVASLIGLLTGTPFGAVVGAMYGANKGQMADVQENTGMTPAEQGVASAAMTAANTAAMGEHGSEGGADVTDEPPPRRRRATPEGVPLRDYLAWLREATAGR